MRCRACPGAGIVVSRAVIRDMFPPAQAQKVMSQVTIYFGVAPAIAPIVGGWLFVHLGWPSIFWFLTLVGVAVGLQLPPAARGLPPDARQPFNVPHLLRGYWQLCSSPRASSTAAGRRSVPFNGMFLYVLAAPRSWASTWGAAPTQFFWFFVMTISGIMGGAWLSGRLAGRIAPKRQIRHGFLIMFVTSVVNLGANLLVPAHVSWALLPIALFALAGP